MFGLFSGLTTRLTTNPASKTTGGGWALEGRQESSAPGAQAASRRVNNVVWSDHSAGLVRFVRLWRSHQAELLHQAHHVQMVEGARDLHVAQG